LYTIYKKMRRLYSEDGDVVESLDTYYKLESNVCEIQIQVMVRTLISRFGLVLIRKINSFLFWQKINHRLIRWRLI
jgi:hypothetical protein